MQTFDFLTHNLNAQQQAAVMHDQGPLLIVAGAGTGKTTVITRRIAHLIMAGAAAPDQILALTFTDKAAAEMEERVDRLLPYGYVQLWISTFHSFCERILKSHAFDIGLPNDFRLLDQTATWLLVRKNLDRFNLDYYRPLGNPTRFIHALLKHFSRAKDEEIFPAHYLDYAEKKTLNADAAPGEGVADEVRRTNEIAQAYHIYEQILLENNALDFGSLITYTLKLFRTRPALLDRYRAQFKIILVDEFQDTNFAQYELIKLLAAPRNNVTVVGDDDQAVYKFRGASIANIMEFKKDFPKAKEIFLAENYRSPQNILDISYEFIQRNNPDRLEFQLAQLAARQGDGENKEVLSKKLRAQGSAPGAIEHLHCETLDDEVEQVISKMENLRQVDSALAWGDFALLVRSNASADPFIEKLAARGIPYQFFALRGLYAKPTIIDIISLCKILDNCHESPNLYRVLSFPFLKISERALVHVSHFAHKKGISLWQATQKIDVIPDCEPPDCEQVKKLTSIIEKLTPLMHRYRASEVFLHIVRSSGYLDSVRSGETPEQKEALDHLNQFYKKIKSFQTEFPSARMKDFLVFIALEQEAGDEGVLELETMHDPDTVKIMTVHSAKGLEFPYVFVVNMVDRRFPTSTRGDAIELPTELAKEMLPQGDAHLQEERRLLYVAMTRAKQGLFFTSAQSYGGSRAKKLSQFLYELGFVEGASFSLVRNTDALVCAARPEDFLRSRQERVSMPLPKKFSFTQLMAYEKCPLQYKFSFVLRIPVFGKPSLSFGKSIHLTLQKFFEAALAKSSARQALNSETPASGTSLSSTDVLFDAKKVPSGEFRNSERQGSLFNSGNETYTIGTQPVPSAQELFGFYEASWIDDWYPNEKIQAEYRARGKEMLQKFYDDLLTAPPVVDAVERDFTLRLPGNAGAQYTLKGRIDRIDRTGNGIEIVDYKTGKSKEEKKLSADDKRQLLLYQIAAEEVFGERVEKLTYQYLETGAKVSFIGSDHEKEDMKARAAATIRQIGVSDFSATPGWHCQFCDFRDICEFRQ